jgi:e3 binding domain
MLVEPEIAPLAKRLAEENNVNWRALMGSGANGRILERDVLEYLARVMAGEEDMNPTAEPLPEGLDAWPEDDVKSYYGVDTISSSESSGYSPDLNEESLFVNAAEPMVSSHASQETLDEDIFLVDEEDLSVATLATHEPIMYDTSLDSLDDDISDVYGSLTLDDIGLDDIALDDRGLDNDTVDLEMVEESFVDNGEEPILEPLVDSFEEPNLEFSDTMSTDEVSTDEMSNEVSTEQEFSDTSSLFVEDFQPELEEAFVAIASDPADMSDPTNVSEFVEDSFADIYTPVEDVVSEFTEDAGFTESAGSTDDLAFTESEVLSMSSDGSSDGSSDETVSVDEVFTEGIFADDVVGHDVVGHDVVTHDVVVQETFVQEIPEHKFEAVAETLDTPVDTQQWQGVPDEASTDAQAWQAESTEQWSEAESTFAQEPSQPIFVPVGVALGTVVAGSFAQGLEDRPEAPLQGLSASTLPLVTYGILLRRHVDLSTLIQAQHAVAEELGHEEPLALTSFLLRAAAKALHKVPLVQGSVGLASIREQGVGMTAIPEASSAPFRDILAQSHLVMSGPLAHDQVALAVADMSGFDIDEAVLNVGIPVLTLGRMMYDNSKGTHHSTLSISGSVSVESGTKFLSAVAELLNSPVRLVV